MEQIQLRQFRIQLQRFFQLGFRNTNDLPLLWDFPETSHARKFQNYTRRTESHKHLYKGIPHSLQRDCTWVDTWVDRFQVYCKCGKWKDQFSKHHQAFCRQQPEPERDFKTKTFHCFFDTRLVCSEHSPQRLTSSDFSGSSATLASTCKPQHRIQTDKKRQQVLLPGNFGFSVCNVLTIFNH